MLFFYLEHGSGTILFPSSVFRFFCLVKYICVVGWLLLLWLPVSFWYFKLVLLCVIEMCIRDRCITPRSSNAFILHIWQICGDPIFCFWLFDLICLYIGWFETYIQLLIFPNTRMLLSFSFPQVLPYSVSD